MNATPLICPQCGELVVAYPWVDDTLIVPLHTDRIIPAADCTASITKVPALPPLPQW